MASPPPQKASGLPNPYAQRSLPNPYASATISAAPVKYTEEQAKAEQQKKAPAFHNPHNIKRPQAKNQAKKTGPVVKKPTMPPVGPVSSGPGPATSSTQQHGIDYYRSTADDDAAIIEERRMRNYEEKQRKKEQKKFNRMFGQWNPQAPHKPERYSNLRAYRASGGYQRKKEGFNAFLRGAAAQYRSRDESEPPNGSRSASSSRSTPAVPAGRPLFAPPASFDDNSAVPSDQAGEDVYTRRMRLSQQPPNDEPSPPTQEPSRAYPPPPPSVTDEYALPPPPPPPPAAPSAAPSYQGATISAPPVRYANATISAPPVRFERPDVPMEDADNEPGYDERPAKRAKISKAEAMMAKMGYKKGQGLGKNNDGVVTHLEVKMRKVPQGASSLDDEGGKVKSQQVWDVRGGTRTQKDEPGKFGEESSVVVTWGCVDGVDWAANADRNDGGIRQDMGEAFSSKFGPVEHVQLDETNKDGAVYIHFQSVLSALNAVNRFDEGWEFRGRKIRAKYYDERKFHAGIYDH
ncbi:g-patch dna repair protein [Stemphylium lycopersici]|nr:g-patch dna repair protein [Stemphylium lycopersici]